MPEIPLDDEIIEITVVSELSLPPSVTLVEAIRQAIFRQSWAFDFPEQAHALYVDLMQHPEMIALLQGFPDEVSVEQLTAKINELIPRLVNSNYVFDLFDDFEELDYSTRSN